MYKLIAESVEVESGLYADIIKDVQYEDDIELAISPGVEPTIYLIPLDKLTANSKEGFDPGQMRNDSYKVFNTYADYCKWFNQNIN